MRRRLAEALVIHVSDALSHAYLAWCAWDSSHRPIYKRIEGFWAWRFRRRSKLLLPLANRLDSDAATTQMIEECWWG